MTIQARTFICAYCGRDRLPVELGQDTYSGFLICKDGDDCAGEIQRQGKAQETALMLKIERLNVERSEAIHKLSQVRHEYKLPDPLDERNKREMARIEGDDQC